MSDSTLTFLVDDVLEAAEHNAWFYRQVQAGLGSANAGNLVRGDDVEARFAARRAEIRRRLEGSD